MASPVCSHGTKSPRSRLQPLCLGNLSGWPASQPHLPALVLALVFAAQQVEEPRSLPVLLHFPDTVQARPISKPTALPTFCALTISFTITVFYSATGALRPR